MSHASTSTKFMARGTAVAAALAGSWRESPSEEASISAGLSEVVPLLLQRGVGGLGWWRCKQCPAASRRLTRPLRDAYLGQAVQAVEYERLFGQLLACLRNAGLEPLLIKGFAAARWYPEVGLRPFGDFDFCLPSEQVPLAQQVLREAAIPAAVDLHAGVPDLPDRSWDEICQRSEAVRIGTTDVRVLGPEDHLRLLAVHFVRHSGQSPRGLCDIATVLEALPGTFDWDYLRNGDQRLVDWILCVIGLSCRLLGARPVHPIVQEAEQRVPRWLERTVLWRWGHGRRRQGFRHYLKHPVEAVQRLNHDGFNPIRGAFQLGLSPFTRVPIPLIQLLGFGLVYVERLKRSFTKRLYRDPDGPTVHQSPIILGQYATGEPARRRLRWPLWVLLFALVLVLAPLTLFDVQRVKGRSMQPYLKPGDRILVNRLAHGLRLPGAAHPLTTWSRPQRGEVVVFAAPGDGKRLVKRVAGVPGDTVEARAGRLLVNGTDRAPFEGASFGPIEVSEGQYFVLGDNHANSMDSRFFGCIDEERIAGRVAGVVLSLK